MKQLKRLIIAIKTGSKKFFERINPLIDRLHREQSRIGYWRATLPLIKFSSVVVLSQLLLRQRRDLPLDLSFQRPLARQLFLEHRNLLFLAGNRLHDFLELL